MAAFVGFCVQSNGIFFPWNLSGDVSYADISAAGGPGDQWDALPTPAKVQILAFVGLLELYSETTFILEKAGQKHYVMGGKPGFFPPFAVADLPHPVPLELWDPFGFTKKRARASGSARVLVFFFAARRGLGAVHATLCEVPHTSARAMMHPRRAASDDAISGSRGAAWQ